MSHLLPLTLHAGRVVGVVVVCEVEICLDGRCCGGGDETNAGNGFGLVFNCSLVSHRHEMDV